MMAIEAVTAAGDTSALCQSVGLARATLYRRRRPAPSSTPNPRAASSRALVPAERQAVLDVLHSERFVDQSPAEVQATLLEEQTYLCSTRTMYRILDQDAMLDAIEAFLARTHVRPAAERVLASVLTVRWDGAAPHTDVRRLLEREIAWARGQLLDVEAGRLVAAFDGPARAVRCGTAVVLAAHQSGIAARGGVHIGECDLSSSAGPVFALSAEIAAAAAPGEVCVSRTVVDLVPGSGLVFHARAAVRGRGHARDLSVLVVSPS